MSNPEPPASSMRIVALLEVLLCSDFPTQLAVDAALRAFGYPPLDSAGQLRVSYVVGLSLADTVLLVGFVWLFLRAHGEKPADVFLGRRSVIDEIRVGIPLIAVALTLGIGVLLLMLRFAPSFHTVQTNPLQVLLRSPRNAALFALVVVVAPMISHAGFDLVQIAQAFTAL
jgi:hypothetical protein